MKVTFIYADFPLGLKIHWRGYYHYGIASLSASLKKAGHQTSLIHLYEPSNQEAFVARVSLEKPDLLAFSVTTNSYQVSLQLLHWLREAGVSIPVIFGGVHVILAPDEVIDNTDIDFACIGEGELPMVELCDCLESGRSPHSILNIWSKEGERIHRNPVRPLLQDLDALPFGDRSLFDYPMLALEKLGIASMMASRGCPFDCSYCCNHAIRSHYPNQKYVRFRSVDSVLAEINSIRQNYTHINAIHFDDDILFLREDWAKEFTEKYKKEIGLPFSSNLRPSNVNRPVIESLADAGCKHLQIGLESGNDSIRKEVLGRHISAENMEEVVRLGHEHDMKVEVNSMVGIPGETISMMLDTVKLNARINPDSTNAAIFYPYPKTRLHDICSDKGYITKRNVSCYYFDSVLHLDTVSRSHTVMVARYFRPLISMYKVLYALRPHLLSRAGEVMLDFLLSRWIVARVAVAVYEPFLWLRRKLTRERRNVLSDFLPPASEPK